MRDNQQGQGCGQRGNQRQKATKGTFRLGSAIIEGRIVKDGPVKRYSQQGNAVDGSDAPGRAVRRPAEDGARHAGIHPREGVQRAGRRPQRVPEQGPRARGGSAPDRRLGRARRQPESYEMHADAIDRKPFPKIGKLIADQENPPAQDNQGGGGYDHSRVDEAADYRNETPLDEHAQPPADDDLGEPWRAAPPQQTDLTEDDVPF